MENFQREVIDRLARIETKLETHEGLPARVAVLERGDSRRNAVLALFAGLPAGLAALWAAMKA